MSIISSREPGIELAIRGSATTTAKHWARDIMTLMRLRSNMNAKPRKSYSQHISFHEHVMPNPS
jgi:hypothetical protein